MARKHTNPSSSHSFSWNGGTMRFIQSLPTQGLHTLLYVMRSLHKWWDIHMPIRSKSTHVRRGHKIILRTRPNHTFVMENMRQKKYVPGICAESSWVKNLQTHSEADEMRVHGHMCIFTWRKMNIICGASLKPTIFFWEIRAQ